MERDPAALLILAPRDPGRAIAVPLPVARRSMGQAPGQGVYLADTTGEMGLWYRLAPVALIGGGFGIGGHNPWEAARLGCAVLHGPEIGNFVQDYKDLHDEAAGREVPGADALLAALDDPGLPEMAARGQALALSRAGDLERLAQALCAMVRA